ncbi:MAG: class I SAM-dependent methyltransferase [Hyphomicrobiaceae bacterium]
MKPQTDVLDTPGKRATPAPQTAPFWDRTARKYASDAIADAGGYERTLARTVEFLSKNDRVLEIGCGTATTALRLAAHVGHLSATDASLEMIKIAREKACDADVANLELGHAWAGDRRFHGQSFDAILAFNVLHLVTDLPGTLASLRESLKPGGLLITKTPCLAEMNVVIPYLALPIARLIGKAPDVRVFSGTELAALVRQSGFEIVAEERHGSKPGRDIRAFLVARAPI